MAGGDMSAASVDHQRRHAKVGLCANGIEPRGLDLFDTIGMDAHFADPNSQR